MKNNKHLLLSSRSLGIRKLISEEWAEKKEEYAEECQMLRSASSWSTGLDETFNKE